MLTCFIKNRKSWHNLHSRDIEEPINVEFYSFSNNSDAPWAYSINQSFIRNWYSSFPVFAGFGMPLYICWIAVTSFRIGILFCEMSHYSLSSRFVCWTRLWDEHLVKKVRYDCIILFTGMSLLTNWSTMVLAIRRLAGILHGNYMYLSTNWNSYAICLHRHSNMSLEARRKYKSFYVIGYGRTSSSATGPHILSADTHHGFSLSGHLT